MDAQEFSYHRNVVTIPLLLVFTCWLVYFLEIEFGYNFNKFGIYPKEFFGLRGIFLAPFIHSDAKHLLNNSIPLAVMLGCLFYFYRSIAIKVLLLGVFFTGLLTWTFGRASYHIGASGIVYFLLGFIFFSGVFRKYYRLIAVSLVFVFLYGSMIWYVLPVEDRISWEGHLSGFTVGLVLAVVFKNKGPQPKTFEFYKNEEFDSYFDEDGNFNPQEPKLEEELESIEKKDEEQ